MDIEHVALIVEDPASVANWYAAHLGLRVVRKDEGPAQMRFLAEGSGHVMLEVYRSAKLEVPDYAAMDPLMLHVAFSADDVAGTRKRLIDAGARPVGEVITGSAGDTLALLRDPWGLAIQLVKRATPLV